MDFEKFFIGASIFLLIITVGGTLYGDMSRIYQIRPQNESFSRLQTVSMNLSAKQLEIQDKIIGSEVSQDNAIDQLIYGAGIALRSVTISIAGVPQIATAAFLELGSLMGYSYIQLTILTIIGFAFIAGIVYLIMRISK